MADHPEPQSGDADVPVVVGRGHIIGALTELTTQLARGRGGSALIEGEAGIGKSLILAVLGRMAVAEGFRFVTAAAEELDRDFPLRAVDTALEAGGIRREPVASAAGVWPPPAGDPVLAGVEHVLDRLDEVSGDRPLVFALDDLQWADDASLLVLDRLSQAARQQPLLVVGAFRSEAGRARLAELRRSMLRRSATLLRLDPLEPGDAVRMGAIRAGGEPGPALRRWLESAAGNPLFIRELVDALGRHGQLRSADGLVDVTPDAAAAPVVVSLENVIAERLATLSPDIQDLLRFASVIGHEFSAAELAEISGRPFPQLLTLLHEALVAGVLEEAGDRLRFRHGLIRAALSQSVPPPVRSGLHAAAAQTLAAAAAPPERVGVHLLQIVENLPSWAAGWLVGDGTDLVYQAPAVAARLIGAALEVGGLSPALREELNARLARSRFQDGDHQAASVAAVRVLAGTTDPDRAGEMVWYQAYGHNLRFEPAAAIETIVQALEQQALSPAWAVRLEVLRALVTTTTGDRPLGAAQAERALQEATRLGDPFGTAYALHVLCLVASQDGDAEQSLAFLDRALGVADFDLAASDLRILLLANRSVALKDLDRSQEAAQSLETARAVAERTGSTRLQAIMRAIGELRFEEGRWDEALLALAASVEDGPPAPSFRVVALARGFMAMIHARRGQTAAAREDLAELAVFADSPGSRPYLLRALVAEAALAEQEAGAAAALAVLEPVLDAEYQLQATTWHMVLPTVLRLARATGRLDLDAEVMAVLGKDGGQNPGPLVTAARLHCQALLNRDIEAGLEAARILAGWPHQAAVCLEDMAEIAAVGDRTRARTLLTEVVARYETLGASADTARAESRLRVHNVRLGVRGARRRPTVGWAALTPTEAKVADLVAEGMTNPEIALRMFLSRRTVQSHVSQILTKLDVPSRSGITRLAVERRRS